MVATAIRTRKASKPTHELHYLARATFKATGAVLYGVESHNLKTGETHTYHVTVIAGQVRGCHNAATGDVCEGRHYTGHCCHGDYVARLESERNVQATASTNNTPQDGHLAEAAAIAPAILGEQFSQDLQAHVEDDLRSEPWAILSKEQKREMYRNMYPDDYGYYGDVA